MSVAGYLIGRHFKLLTDRGREEDWVVQVRNVTGTATLVMGPHGPSEEVPLHELEFIRPEEQFGDLSGEIAVRQLFERLSDAEDAARAFSDKIAELCGEWGEEVKASRKLTKNLETSEERVSLLENILFNQATGQTVSQEEKDVIQSIVDSVNLEEGEP